MLTFGSRMRPVNTLDPLERAIAKVGLGKLASRLGVSGQAVRKWQTQRRMPRTEWTGETSYSDVIEVETGGEVTRAELLSKWPPLQAALEQQSETQTGEGPRQLAQEAG